MNNLEYSDKDRKPSPQASDEVSRVPFKYIDNVEKWFRHPTYRPGQREALLDTANALDEGEKFVIAELPTGLGKSDIAMALVNTATFGLSLREDQIKRILDDDSIGVKDINYNQTYVVTSQKPLQDQYKKDFLEEGRFFDIRGRNNYTCEQPSLLEDKKTCDENKRDCPLTSCPACPYYADKRLAQFYPITSTNNAFYATATIRWGKRVLSVLDECHNLPTEVMNQVSFTITDKVLIEAELGKYRYKEIEIDEDPDPGEFMSWIEGLIKPLGSTTDIMVGRSQDSKVIFSKKEGKLLDKLIELSERIVRFLMTSRATRWIIEYKKRVNGDRAFIARPLDSGPFAPDRLFKQSHAFFLQSATIVDFTRFCEELGIPRDQLVQIQKPSPFPLSNRPIYNMASAWMGHKALNEVKEVRDEAGNLVERIENESLHEITRMVQLIMDAFPKEKGIIHTNSYKIQKFLIRHLRTDRLIAPEGRDRSLALEVHSKEKAPSVLISPSMTEGIDLKDDLARFSIVCKIPWPDLGDKRVKLKQAQDPAWYRYQAAKTLVQTVGRGVRSQTDWCHTFILDKGLDNFLRSTTLSPDFTKAIRPRFQGMKLIKP